jgi:cell division protein FtsN
MSRDYKGTDRRRSGGRRNGSSLLVGVLIGLVLGLGIALGVAWYINKMPSPFSSRPHTPAKSEIPKDDAKSSATQSARVDEKAAKGEDKPRFDFYKILPSDDNEKQPKEAAKDTSKASTPAGKETFFLQAGAFQNAPDADNLKARLALLGIEASIETTTASDKGVLHRVRIGPYTSVEELNRARDTLKQNGVPTTLVKAREPER